LLLVISEIGSCEVFFLAWVRLDLNPPIYACRVLGITGVHHHTWIFCWDGVLLTFSCPSWPQTTIPPISTARATGIIIMSPCIQPKNKRLLRVYKIPCAVYSKSHFLLTI
jgi:hypothetical protein